MNSKRIHSPKEGDNKTLKIQTLNRRTFERFFLSRDTEREREEERKREEERRREHGGLPGSKVRGNLRARRDLLRVVRRFCARVRASRLPMHARHHLRVDSGLVRRHASQLAVFVEASDRVARD